MNLVFKNRLFKNCTVLPDLFYPPTRYRTPEPAGEAPLSPLPAGGRHHTCLRTASLRRQARRTGTGGRPVAGSAAYEGCAAYRAG